MALRSVVYPPNHVGNLSEGFEAMALIDDYNTSRRGRKRRASPRSHYHDGIAEEPLASTENAQYPNMVTATEIIVGGQGSGYGTSRHQAHRTGFTYIGSGETVTYGRNRPGPGQCPPIVPPEHLQVPIVRQASKNSNLEHRSSAEKPKRPPSIPKQEAKDEPEEQLKKEAVKLNPEQKPSQRSKPFRANVPPPLKLRHIPEDLNEWFENDYWANAPWWHKGPLVFGGLIAWYVVICGLYHVLVEMPFQPGTGCACLQAPLQWMGMTFPLGGYNGTRLRKWF